jgi:PAS domain S-box-containing protein
MTSSVIKDEQCTEQPALQLIYDTAPIGLAFLSLDCRYLRINQRLTELCGISVKGHLGRTVRDCVPALASSVEAIVRSIVETGEPVTDVEVAGQRPDQVEERFWITHWHPQRAPAGNIIGINVAAEEITERKRHERELRSAREAAEAALRHLQATQASLVEAERLAALGRLVAGVAHEINSPVGTGLTVASELERKCVLFAEEVARGDLKRSSLTDFITSVQTGSSQLGANLRRAAELVQSFKQVAVDQGYLDRRVFDLSDLTEQILAGLRPGFRKNNLTLGVDCQSGVTINSYPGPYGQVLTNLLLNAVAHAFPDRRGGHIDVVVRGAGPDDVEIVVADKGYGMSLDVRRQAFNPFFTTRRHEGKIGLGLHVVHNIVTGRLGGLIHLDSEIDAGTTVRLILPRTAPGEQIGTAATG